MRKITTGTACALLLAVIGLSSVPGIASSAERGRQADEPASLESVIQIPARANFPLNKKLDMGKGKSVLVQFPFELRDVLVADPETVDAVVQSSNRVFLIGKKTGVSNAFFFDTKGRQVLSMEISVSKPPAASQEEVGTLDKLFRRLIPGSNIKSEMIGSVAVLTGSVRAPVDSKRANDIACQFVAHFKGVNRTLDSNYSSTTTSSSNLEGAPNGTIIKSESQSEAGKPLQNQAAACASDTKLVINMLAVEGEEQVMLKVTVAEVQRSVLKQFGMNIGALVNQGNFSTAILSQNALPLTSAAGLGALPLAGVDTASSALQNIAIGSPVAGRFINSGVDTIFNAGNTQLSAILRAMERNGLIRTLAEPTLTAVSGETANFLAGGEYPIPVVDSDGKLSVNFKKFGIGLAFTPVVLSEGRISLKIDTEVSELTNEGAVVLSSISIPALKTRQARSTVELPSGGSLAIAGLISDSTKQNIEGFPGLKDVPVIGTLFRSRDFQKQETELVVIVTPYMVRPTARQNLARPDDGLAPASDLKANLLGHLNRIYGKGRELPPGGLKGDHGFIVE
jgi:pilus assembly protein CpaC